MKPIYLEFCGINSFSEKTQIDFRALLAGGVFGIFGDTGSGKSTILDSIHFALYGVVDRVSQAFNDCINSRSEGVFVTFDFEIVYAGERKTFRVKREKKRKAGSAKAYLYEWKDGAWHALAEGVNEVDKQVEEIIGLSFNDFKTCIALPQGDFDALVHSKVSERVKLMARLFNLEKYGERLSIAVNSRHAEALKKLEILRAQMGENEGADEEKVNLAQTLVKESEDLVNKLKADVEKRSADYTQASALLQEKDAFEKVKEQWTRLTAKLPEMQEKRNLLQKLPSANAVKQSYSAWKTASARLEETARLLEKSRLAYQVSVEKKMLAQKKLQDSGIEDRLLEENVTLSKIRAGAQDLEYERQCYNQLVECRKAYQNCKYDGEEEDFEKGRLEIENQLAVLGEDEDLLTYLKRNLKGIMLAETYGEVRADLRGLQEKYPQTQTDVQALIEKYSIENNTEFSAEDIQNAQTAFKHREEQKKRLKERLESLEKRRQAYDKWLLEREAIQKQGELLKGAYDIAFAKTETLRALGTETDCQKRIFALKEAQNKLEKELETAVQTETDCVAKVKQWEGVLAQYQTLEKETQTEYKTALSQYGYAQIEDALQILARVGEEEKAKATTDKFFEEYALYKAKMEETDEKKFAFVNETQVAELRKSKEETEEQSRLETLRLGERKSNYDRLQLAREKFKAQEKELAEREHEEKLCEELRQLVRGNRFLEFIASEYLQEICQSASKTLVSLTGGKYFLKYDDKEFKVGDNLNGGTLRVVKTLSGGETFLVSLSLALALSGAICAQSMRPIEFFFLDEGFGTLDEKLVDTVMDVLGKLSKSFAVGLISHVEELKRRIDYKAVVTGATETHGSTVRIETF